MLSGNCSTTTEAFCAAIGALGGCGQWELALHLMMELAARGWAEGDTVVGPGLVCYSQAKPNRRREQAARQ